MRHLSDQRTGGTIYRYGAREMSGPLPPVLYKYLPLQHARSMVERGELMLSTLAWFQRLEDLQRGDRLEGIREYLPVGGHRVTRTRRHEDGTFLITPLTLPLNPYRAAAARSGSIFIYSTARRSGLTQFTNSDEGPAACVEIHDPGKFFILLRAALRRLPRAKVATLIHDTVGYYATDDPPDTEHELPHRAVMLKHEHFRDQHEFRFAFGTKADVFDYGKMDHVLTELGAPQDRVRPDPAKHRWLIRVGSLVDCCRLP